MKTMTLLFQTLVAVGLKPDFSNDDLQSRSPEAGGGFDWYCPLLEMRGKRVPFKAIDKMAREIIGRHYLAGSARKPQKKYWGCYHVVLTLRDTYVE